ncbi:hypothetical protein QVD17_37150 [Tagetes erecta]|uniref:Acyltransferase n=1 Tax=Tagetes erecta TaxID=13708 RepID=A0AAD8NJT3_TARER|nr:hypothetical protein QVD17_37150 [Tagetes erecta]
MTKDNNATRLSPPPSEEPTPAEFAGKKGSPIHEFIAMIMWLGTLPFVMFLIVALFLFLPLFKSFILLGILIVLIMIPINENNKWGLVFSRHIYKNVAGYFPATVYVEDIKSFNPDQAYVFGYEPHSVWPLGAGILLDLARYFPITKIKILASSAMFYTPLMRHYWTWLGVSSVNRTNFLSLLKAGCSCIVIPGGVQEVFHMKHDYEVAFIKARRGFIRLAMETNSPVVPVFAFGQSNAYNWWKPRGKFFLKLSRVMKFSPIIYWGTFWSFIPFRRPILMVVGKPIHFKKNSTPSMEEVTEVHQQFVEALQNLFDRHKARAGYPDLELQIIFVPFAFDTFGFLAPEAVEGISRIKSNGRFLCFGTVTEEGTASPIASSCRLIDLEHDYSAHKETLKALKGAIIENIASHCDSESDLVISRKGMDTDFNERRKKTILTIRSCKCNMGFAEEEMVVVVVEEDWVVVRVEDDRWWCAVDRFSNRVHEMFCQLTYLLDPNLDA